jgi:hypothetical protein
MASTGADPGPTTAGYRRAEPTGKDADRIFAAPRWRNTRTRSAVFRGSAMFASLCRFLAHGISRIRNFTILNSYRTSVPFLMENDQQHR